MLGDPPQEKQRQAGCRECAESRGLCRVRHSALRQQANASLSGLGFPIGNPQELSYMIAQIPSSSGLL